MDKKRIKVGLLFSYDEQWIGGTYYILNLIQSLNELPDADKPDLVIYHQSAREKAEIERTQYPYLRFYIVPTEGVLARYTNKITRYLFNKNVMGASIDPQSSDVIFPGTTKSAFRYFRHQLYWIPDFQNCHLPQFFSSKELTASKRHQTFLSKGDKHIIFSSQDAQNDFSTFYADSTARTNVVPFAVTHTPQYKDLSIGDLLVKFALQKPYLLSPNQFWQHKNHKVVIEAAAQLKKAGYSCQIAFTGKERDYRNAQYVASLKKMVTDLDLTGEVLFLGFIDRNEQLKLMSEAVAVIQPSLFEGWSTVIEDAKAMNQWVIASDIKVNIEQLGASGFFFEKHSSDALAALIIERLTAEKPPLSYNYADNKKIFAEKFMKVIREMTA